MPSTSSEAFVGESVDAMTTPARPPSVANSTKRGRGFGVFRVEATDVDDDDDDFERVPTRMPKRGSPAETLEDSLELLYREVHLLVANIGAVENKFENQRVEP